MNMKTFLATVALSGLALAACAPTSQLQLSSGRIGCATEDLVIGNVASSRNSESWSATCRGQTYFCSSTSDFREVICRPQAKAVAVAAPAPAAAPAVAAAVTPAAEPAAPAAPAVTEPAAPPATPAAEAAPAAAAEAPAAAK